jgi:hypothetical protein
LHDEYKIVLLLFFAENNSDFINIFEKSRKVSLHAAHFLQKHIHIHTGYETISGRLVKDWQ